MAQQKSNRKEFLLWNHDLLHPKTNIAPENRPSQKEIHLPTINFQGRLLLVLGRVNSKQPFPFENSQVAFPTLSAAASTWFDLNKGLYYPV